MKNNLEKDAHIHTDWWWRSLPSDLQRERRDEVAERASDETPKYKP